MAPRAPRPRDAAATKARLIDAATAEFAGHGLAGARVDRIAAAAGANKQLIYAYFGSKRALFDEVIAARVAGLLEEVPFTADDLPGYAVRLREFSRSNPQFVRLLLWHMLECPGELPMLGVSVESTRAKLESLQQAQERGTVGRALPAPVLLAQVLALVHGDLLTGAGAMVSDDELAAAVSALTAL